MKVDIDLLVIGAGPFGLGLAAFAKSHGIRFQIVGKSMDFWKSNMPRGMLLRSGIDWHIDPDETHTIEAYREHLNDRSDAKEPLSLDFYLKYVGWFIDQKGLSVEPTFVSSLRKADDRDLYVAELENGRTMSARNVVIAAGFKNFKHIPDVLAAKIPSDQSSHTCDLVEFTHLKGKNCLIIGGRQSAFEWAALLREAGVAEVHVSHRHKTPDFTDADWSWVTEMIRTLEADSAWYRSLSEAEKVSLGERFWAEGRLKLEPWIWPRINHDNVYLWPDTQVKSCTRLDSGSLEIVLDSGERLTIDHVIFATGYNVDLSRLPILANGNLLRQLRMNNGFPMLDENMQTNLPGLYITSMPATQDFGPFFAFTVSVVASSRIIGRNLLKKLPSA